MDVCMHELINPVDKITIFLPVQWATVVNVKVCERRTKDGERERGKQVTGCAMVCVWKL